MARDYWIHRIQYIFANMSEPVAIGICLVFGHVWTYPDMHVFLVAPSSQSPRACPIHPWSSRSPWPPELQKWKKTAKCFFTHFYTIKMFSTWDFEQDRYSATKWQAGYVCPGCSHELLDIRCYTEVCHESSYIILNHPEASWKILNASVIQITSD